MWRNLLAVPAGLVVTVVAVMGLQSVSSLLGSLLNWTSFAHPAWFVAGQLLLYPLVLFLVWLAVEPRVGAHTHD